MPRRVPVPPELLRRPFTVAEALGRGVPQHVLDGPRFRRPHRGVRVPRELPDSVLVRAAAASLVLHPRAALTGWSVVALLDLPTPLRRRDPLRGRLSARVPAGIAVPRVDGLDVGEGLREDRLAHLVEPAARCLLPPGSRGLRIQLPEDAWCEVAPSMPHADAVALGDAVRRRWTDDAGVAAAVDALAGTRGVAAVRRAAAAVRWRVDSAMESHARVLLVGAGLPEPRCGLEVVDGRGRTWAVDLCWPQWRVVVEYDGDGHRTGDFTGSGGSGSPVVETAAQRAARERAARAQWRQDTAKRGALREDGWNVIVITGDSITKTPRATLDEVRRALRAAGAPL